MLRVEQGVDRLVRADELPHRLVGQHDQRADGAADDVPVVHVHDRRPHVEVLGDADGLYAVVVCLLVVLTVELDPAAVAATHGVAVVAVDVDRARQRAVDRRHDDRQAVAGGDVEQLPHEGEALGRGRRHGARPAGGRADDGAHGRVLRFDGDELRGDLAVGHHLRVELHDLGLRRYRVGADDVGIDLAHRLGDGLVAGDGERAGLCFGHVVTLPGRSSW